MAAAVTAYLTSVQDRLRRVRAGPSGSPGPADEEIKRRALADDLAREAEARAEEEAKGRELATRLAREAEARAIEERKRRRTTVGLAASVLALTTVSGLSYT